MAIWIDDTLTEQDEWLDMSADARGCLIELWAYCKRARNDGVIKTTRLHKASDLFSVGVMAELIDNGWLHKDATGCGTDTCPTGIEGVSVMHNYLRHQESARDMSTRIEVSREKAREKSLKGNHQRWHIERSMPDPKCPLCIGDAPK
jgi:hypothetical protein